jgi:hypothetical protein
MSTEEDDSVSTGAVEAGDGDQGAVVDNWKESGLASKWRFETGATSGPFRVDIPENPRRAKARNAYKTGRKTQPAGEWSGKELVPTYLKLRVGKKEAVLRSYCKDGADGDLLVPKKVFKVTSGDVVLAAGTIWGYRRYRLVRPPAVYALAGLALGIAAAAVNVSLAIGKTLSPPPIVISSTAIAVWEGVAVFFSVVALVIVFWAGNISEAGE